MLCYFKYCAKTRTTTKSLQEQKHTMSLSYQINIRILLSAVLILIVGSVITMWHARTAIDDEINSSVNLTAHIIACGLSQTIPSDGAWLSCISAIKETRHLKIELLKPNGEILGIGHKTKNMDLDNSPPAWFVRLIGGEKAKVEKQITTAIGEQFSLSIQANPLDEIKEVWEESLGFFGTILVLTLLTFLSVFLYLNKSIKSINKIVNALHSIETGRYQQSLPDFETTEYNSIAKAINHMTSELNKIQADNISLTQHSLEIQENERKQLAQELHDELGQSLTAIKMMAITANRKPSEIKPMTDSISAICDNLINVVRSMMHQLHPLVLTELGLRAALEDMITHWTTKHSELNLTLNYDDQVDLIDSKITIQVFRIIQECLTNIVRHAEASVGNISVAKSDNSPNRLCFTVTDNGKGCNVNQIRTGFGLLGIKERVQSLGGHLIIQTQADKGMQIDVNIPY
jgi:two-component system, NarL family, sensor histidine kinase UhpB